MLVIQNNITTIVPIGIALLLVAGPLFGDRKRAAALVVAGLLMAFTALAIGVQLKKAIQIVKKHGGENVTLLVTVIGGQQTNALTMLVTAENWTKFGQIQEAVYGDPKMQALMAETLKIATWEIYTAQTLEL